MARTRTRRSIGTRLTLWGAGITLALCTLLCAVLYAGALLGLRHEVDRFVEGELQEFAGYVTRYATDHEALDQFIRGEVAGRNPAELAFRLVDEDGRVLAQSDPAGGPDGWGPLPRRSKRWPGAPGFATVHEPTCPYPFRVGSVTIDAPDGRAIIAQTRYGLDRMSASLAMFRRVCLVGLALAALLSLAVGRALATRSLRPLQQMVKTAENIGATSLSERMPLTGTGDELDQLAATLNTMFDRVERHVRQIQRFTADASHELRSPLAALRGNAEVALTYASSAEELREVIEGSIDEYRRLSRIAEDLLLLASAESGRRILDRRWIDAGAAVGEVIELYAPLAEDRGVRLSYERDPDLWLDADEPKLRQLAGNLIDNAIKHTPEGGAVDVSLTKRDGSLRLNVRDNGHGIAPQHLPYVFDRFYRVDDARSRDRGGTGLGLAISLVIAQAHGGTITMVSEPGRGTEVTASLAAGPREAAATLEGRTRAAPGPEVRAGSVP